MKLSSGAGRGWYAPDVGDNRETKLFRVRIEGTTLGDVLKEKLERAEVKAADPLDDIRDYVKEVVGMSVDKDGAEVPVTNGAELAEALLTTGEVAMALRIHADIDRAIRSKKHLEAGLVP